MKTNRIIQYYNECYPDYKLIWRSHKNLCIHYGFYDNGQKHDEALLRMIEVLAEKAGITKEDRILDVGCGVGGSSIWLAENIGCHAVGIDISENFLAIGASVVRERGLDKLVTLKKMDFVNPDFPDSSFDVLWALESSCYARNKYPFLEQARRVLKPSGRIVIADGFPVKPSKEVTFWLRGWAAPKQVTVAQFGKYLAQLRFTNITYENITEKVMPSSVRMYRHAMALYPLGKLLELLRLRTKSQTANILSAIYQHRTLVKGLWEYGIFTAEKAE